MYLSSKFSYREKQDNFFRNVRKSFLRAPALKRWNVKAIVCLSTHALVGLSAQALWCSSAQSA